MWLAEKLPVTSQLQVRIVFAVFEKTLEVFTIQLLVNIHFLN